MVKLKGIGHINLYVTDQERSRWFYGDVLGFKVAEQDPEHGGVFMTLGQNFHTLDFAQHPNPASVQKPQRGQVGLIHIAFEVPTYEALREAYVSLLDNGIAVDHATNHANQRSIYFNDPDGNGLEIYYELPYSLELFPNGRTDVDDKLEVTKPGEPVPAWLLEEWPGPEMKARIEAIRGASSRESGAPTATI